MSPHDPLEHLWPEFLEQLHPHSHQERLTNSVTHSQYELVRHVLHKVDRAMLRENFPNGVRERVLRQVLLGDQRHYPAFEITFPAAVSQEARARFLAAFEKGPPR